MSIPQPEFEYVDRATETIRYLEHGWPSGLCRWHSHVEYEVHLIVESRGKAFVGDYIGVFEPGSLYLTGPNLPHNWVTDPLPDEKPVAVRDMLVQFSQDSIDNLTQAFADFRELAPMFALSRSGILFEGFDPTRARRHLAAIRDASGPARILAFLRFLLLLNEHPKKTALSMASVLPLEGQNRQARIAVVVDHITQNFAEDLCVSDAADMAGMSTTAFSRNFQKATGKRFVEFVNQVRIGQACSMLLATDDHVSTICHDVGFQNIANFNRHFRKMKQMTPSEYRDVTRSGLAPMQRGDQ